MAATTLAAAASGLSGLPTAAAAKTTTALHNIVLVHGAWVDGSGWRPVYNRLIKKGYHVTLVQEPETSLAADVAATKRVIDDQDGPVLLVGHSYGGSVITEAGADPKVAGLVYVAAHAPDVGEDEHDLGKKYPTKLSETKGAIVVKDGFTHLQPALLPKLFAPDLPLAQARFMAQSQVYTAVGCFSAPMTVAAWKTKPTWGIVAGADQIISPKLEQFYYTRAHAHITMIPGASHSVYESHPDQVAAVIEDAAQHALADAGGATKP
ncbi:alpha/beta hydrolase [Thioclava sp. BHET1]|nr:alpha/beta hydrolase [Thioclava sp. BHET1]